MTASETKLRAASAALALAGVAVATYIAIAEAGGNAPACLAGSSGCATVTGSSYSELAGIGVAAIGVAGYAMLFGAAAVSGDGARFAGLLLALVGFGFSAYLTYLELFEIDAICQWCIASAVLMTALLVVNGIRAFRFAGAEFSAAPRSS